MKFKTKKGFAHIEFTTLNPFQWQINVIKQKTITGYLLGPIEINFHH